MKTDRELLEQALKLVSKYHARETILVDWEKSVIEAISARLNERESSDKPVAWVSCDGYLSHYRLGDEYIPLYRHQPPARKLTDEEIIQIGHAAGALEGNHMLPIAFARAIERRINGEKE